ncbi:dihydrofolate reductase [Sinorhizobium phage phiN3]|uniref:dihydrofolate reductase n=1 Tax=Sinorhizobium phage phiN3 TaxID=1647405 RepID=A0A0F6WD35_9CAUD|nr:dihydrofolate reductase [Sinorhizobium phage phiN3]AKF13617.1 dihydrofolate reductase [Sinorhizobium phage phiN3]
MNISAIVAMDETGGIGKNGTLPWEKDPADMRWFQRFTKGGTLIMGRKTYEDEAFPKPLPDRLSVVIGGLKDYDYPNSKDTIFLSKIDWDMFKKYFQRPILIGGATLYNKAIREKAIESLYVTSMLGDYGCDTFIDKEALNANYEGKHADWHRDFPLFVYTKRT